LAAWEGRVADRATTVLSSWQRPLRRPPAELAATRPPRPAPTGLCCANGTNLWQSSTQGFRDRRLESDEPSPCGSGQRGLAARHKPGSKRRRGWRPTAPKELVASRLLLYVDTDFAPYLSYVMRSRPRHRFSRVGRLGQPRVFLIHLVPPRLCFRRFSGASLGPGGSGANRRRRCSPPLGSPIQARAGHARRCPLLACRPGGPRMLRLRASGPVT